MRSVILDARANPWGTADWMLLTLCLQQYPKTVLSFFHVGNTGSNPVGDANTKPNAQNGGLNDDRRSRPDPVVSISESTDRQFIQFDEVRRLFPSRVFYGLPDDPASLVDKDHSVMRVCAGPQFQRTALCVHFCDGFDVRANLVRENADGSISRNFVDVQVKHFLVDVRVDDEDVLRGPGNDGTQVAVEGVFVARVVRAFDFFFRQLELERPDQSPQQGLKLFYP